MSGNASFKPSYQSHPQIGHWFIGLILNGQLIANQLPQQPEAKHETPIGWAGHYAVSIAYADVLFFSTAWNI